MVLGFWLTAMVKRCLRGSIRWRGGGVGGGVWRYERLSGCSIGITGQLVHIVSGI